jgi:hypothetical protein
MFSSIFAIITKISITFFTIKFNTITTFFPQVSQGYPPKFPLAIKKLSSKVSNQVSIQKKYSLFIYLVLSSQDWGYPMHENGGMIL